MGGLPLLRFFLCFFVTLQLLLAQNLQILLQHVLPLVIALKARLTPCAARGGGRKRTTHTYTHHARLRTPQAEAKAKAERERQAALAKQKQQQEVRTSCV